MAKKVLLVCKETYSWPMHYLAQILKDEGHTVAAFFIMPHEVLLKHPDYSQFVAANPAMAIFTTRDNALRYFHDVKAGCVQLDWDYIHKIEREYSHFKPLRLQVLSSQMFSTYSHYRYYYHDLPWDNQLYFMQLYYQRVEEILDDFKPDVIYDSDISEHGRTVLLEVSYALGIPYVTLEHARFRNYFLPTLTLSTEEEAWLVEAFQMKKQELQACADLSKSLGYQALQEYRSQYHILPSEYASTHHAGRFQWKRDTRQMINHICTTIKSNLPYWRPYFRHVTTPLFSDPVRRTIFHVEEYARKVAIRYFNVFEQLDLEREHYILFPLHLIPESSTLTKAPFYLNEEFLLESVSKSALPHQRVLVKEHYPMIGERPLSVYRKIKRLPNVTLVDPFMFNDPRPYVEHADGVITITGTSALEAALLGKPSIIFGPTPYAVLNCVQQLSDVRELPHAIRLWQDHVVDDLELAAYLEVVMEWGAELSMSTLLRANSDPAKVHHQAELLYGVLQRGEYAFHSCNNKSSDTDLIRR